MFRVGQETPEDGFEVEMLYDHAFAPGREALSSYRLRDGVAPVAALGRVARDEYDSLVGAVRIWPALVGARAVLLLGPIAVHATRQGEGLGAVLMSESLDAAEKAGWARVILVGDLPYYRRFGFERIAVVFPPPTNPERVLGVALRPGALAGLSGEVVRWPEGRVVAAE